MIPRANPEYYQIECGILAEFGFAMRQSFRDANRYLVDLSLDEAAQMQSFEQKWRYNLRQAMKNGIEARICESKHDLDTFYALHAAMVARKQFHAGDPVHLVTEMMARLPGSLRPQIALAYHEGRPVVGAVVARLGDTAFYVFGASDDTALPLKAGYALQWWIVRWLSGSGVRWYDLGSEAQEPGLRQFKKGFVGRRGAVVAMHGEYDRWTSLGGRLIADAIYGVRHVQRAIRTYRYHR